MVGDGSHLSAGEVAALLDLGKTTVHRMFDERDGLDGYSTERGGHRRISAVSVARLLLARPPGARRDAGLAELRELGVDVDGVARSLAPDH